MNALQLDANAGQGGGKAGAGSRAALMNDLLENMDKELEKLRRNEENLKVRKIRAVQGDYKEETEEERAKARDQAVHNYVEGAGNTVINADQNRV